MDQETKKLLIEKASSALENAHAPYSGYKVGAALLTKDGTVYKGCNMENSSYGLAICAERNAFAAAIQSGEREFTAITIAASGNETPYPCGACLQVIAEFCSGEFTIIVMQADKMEEYQLEEMLPKRFCKNHTAENN